MKKINEKSEHKTFFIQETQKIVQHLVQEMHGLVVKEKPLLTIIHFNDVYDIDVKGSSQGIVNFKAAIEEVKKQYPEAMILFSGDCFSPSHLSNLKKGWQMVHSLNLLNMDAACVGNHEFDFEYKHTLELFKGCKFPWLLGNIKDAQTHQLVQGVQPYLIKQINGLKIGIIGIVGDDFTQILSDEYENVFDYEPYLSFAEKTSQQLRVKEKCDLIIGLTHMRNKSDRTLAASVPGLDIILGGHDHCIMKETFEKLTVIKSGSNFNNFSLINVHPNTVETNVPSLRFNFQHELRKVETTFDPDLQLVQYVRDLVEEYNKYDEVLGFSMVGLQTRFEHIRSHECNYGNFIADLFRFYYDCDMCIINAGLIRIDEVIPAGPLKYSLLSKIFNSPIVVKEIPGEVLFQALEFSVSSAPDPAGAFLSVSGLSFTYDYKKIPRVQKIQGGSAHFGPQRKYSVAMPAYISHGGDGFGMFKDCPMILDQVQAVTILTLLLRFFRLKEAAPSLEGEMPLEMPALRRTLSKRTLRIKELQRGFTPENLVCISPEVEQRVQCLNL